MTWDLWHSAFQVHRSSDIRCLPCMWPFNPGWLSSGNWVKWVKRWCRLSSRDLLTAVCSSLCDWLSSDKILCCMGYMCVWCTCVRGYEPVGIPEVHIWCPSVSQLTLLFETVFQLHHLAASFQDHLSPPNSTITENRDMLCHLHACLSFTWMLKILNSSPYLVQPAL